MLFQLLKLASAGHDRIRLIGGRNLGWHRMQQTAVTLALVAKALMAATADGQLIELLYYQRSRASNSVST